MVAREKVMTGKNGSSAIDRLALDQIRMLEGSGRKGLLGKVIALFLYDSKKLMRKIQSSAESGDRKLFLLAVHALKSSSADIGAIGIFEICREIEKELFANIQLSIDNPLLKLLKEEYDLAFCELQDILDSESE